MLRQFRVAVAILSMVSLHQAVAQTSTTPGSDSGPSMVMRCRDCGIVESIRELPPERKGLTPNPDTQAPVGLVMYIPFGHGAKETESYAGTVGNREWRERTVTTRFEFTVRMDDGGYKVAQKDGVSSLRIGDPVRLSGGQIERR